MKERSPDSPFHTQVPATDLKVRVIFRLFKKLILHMGNQRTNTKFAKSIDADGLFFIYINGPAFHNIEE